ncbi:NADH-quinone oxidoreductase subunit N [Flavobacterium akiainvivens]|uniref:NADH-quinone oxidoreductase subunit N n=1 Tax=Flavobacterium akiainvivens TaxID=1202724 RepID=A0A0M8MKG7_9FLAO|nr:NADH-quinone oxidoreductase subunit N [Flavobacterium akiainvivens]KOS07378.1 NADH-quinone oxidoreductase subunit N [Flavobacterium akiainvivens]SFQ47400.1 NADH dehydrogenase subunit N [Flavobacterium akiainvivens]
MEILIAIAGLGIICLIAEIFNARKAIVPISIVGLIAVLVYTVGRCLKGGKEFISGLAMDGKGYFNMLVSDKYSLAFSSLFILLAIFLIALSPDFHKNHKPKLSDFVATKLFLLTGAIAMVAFGNLSMFFLGIEVLSISLYVLAASEPKNLKSNEAGMKYFLMGAFASGLILFGIALIYGATGSFDTAVIQTKALSPDLPKWFSIGFVLLSIGLLFKIAAVPFHFWAPDVYEGSPALTTATMSTLAKVAAIAAFFKLAYALNPVLSGRFITIINVVAIASMLIGNLVALKQTNVKRMLAFSGISHAGYMLLIFQLHGLTAAQSNLFFYAVAYSIAGIAAFAVVLSVCGNKGDEQIFNFNGLGKTNPVLALVLTCALLSMAGIPVFAGFFAKFNLFSQVLSKGMNSPSAQGIITALILVIAAVVSSIISVGYYFKLIIAMYSKEPNEDSQPLVVPFAYKAVAIVSFVLIIAIGLWPDLASSLIRRTVLVENMIKNKII